MLRKRQLTLLRQSPTRRLRSTLFFLLFIFFLLSTSTMPPLFDHEKLEVYQRALEFCAEATGLLDQLPKSSSLWSQLDRASISIPLNIAEGNGKCSVKDRCRFFDIACGSTLECAAAIDIAVARNFIDSKSSMKPKRMLAEIMRMLVGLIKANDPERDFGRFRGVQEEGEFYRTGNDQDGE